MGLWVHHDERRPSPPVTERRTVDGVVVRAGDRVWIDRLGIGVRHTKLSPMAIGAYWSIVGDGKAYADEAACVRAAITARKREIAKARGQIRSANAYAEKLRARLAALEKGTGR